MDHEFTLENWREMVMASGPVNWAEIKAMVLKTFQSSLAQYGCGHKDELLAIAYALVDKLVAYDIPQIPNWIESIIDPICDKTLKDMLREQADRLCPVAPAAAAE